ncbi:RagB/SusD family nutrient uptake outer membrane protein [Chitinophaga sp.]|uniref:RagB/SusD family nutrient uptake outer membrane protein n=1 Tax=Chitinophaga sp. TaxID=1869181 RepID=UPI0031E1D2D3
MKARIYLALILMAGLMAGCKKDFLVRDPLDKLDDDSYWANEKNLRTFAYGFYTTYFVGYASGFTFGPYFYQGQSLNDDFGPTSPPQFTKIVPATDGGWSFTNIRKANIFIDRIGTVPGLTDEARNHWWGVARFFRALAYSELVNTYGDVPWFSKPPLSTEKELIYKPRDPRAQVMDSVLADFKFAAENVRAADGEKGLNVTKWVVMAYMSRIMLFEGTWQKYHNLSTAKAVEYLTASKWAANEVITKGGFKFTNAYRESFNSLDLSKNEEMIMYRRYATGLLTHSLNSYVNREGQTGPNKNLIETYLCTNGLPIDPAGADPNPLYQGDKNINAVMANRDPRMFGTYNMEIRPNGSYNKTNLLGVSTSGYCTLKFLNDEIKDQSIGLSNLNPTHAPVIRYGEVLVSYAEAAAELGTLGQPGITQEDLDKSINVIRKRPTGIPGNNTKLPDLQVIGGQPAVGGTVYDDEKRDPLVPAMIWEIRRERRLELVMEGFRLDDLRRWKKLVYTDTEKNPDINRGAWIVRSEWNKQPPATGSWLKDVTLTGANEGYIIPSPVAKRIFESDKVYLQPIPLNQIKLYEDEGAELSQNPGWTQ